MARYYIIDDYGNIYKTHDRAQALAKYAAGDCEVIDTAVQKQAAESEDGSADPVDWIEVEDLEIPS